MGCGETLFVGSGGYITCSYVECPAPDAVTRILDDGEILHVVVVGDEGFDIQHPLRERLNGELFKCGLHEWMQALSGPPAKPGRYRVRESGENDWSFIPVAQPDAQENLVGETIPGEVIPAKGAE